MSEHASEAERLLLERFGHDSLISLATAEGQTPHVRHVNAYWDSGAFYVLTHALSGKMRQIARNPQVALAGEWFTGHGRAVNLGAFLREENRAIADRMRLEFAAWLDNGHVNLEDEHTVILKIELTDGVLFSHGMRYDIRPD